MSTQKPQPKDRAAQPDTRDDLALDAETVKDLEPGGERADAVKGGGSGSGGGLTASGSWNCRQ